MHVVALLSNYKNKTNKKAVLAKVNFMIKNWFFYFFKKLLTILKKVHENKT